MRKIFLTVMMLCVCTETWSAATSLDIIRADLERKPDIEKEISGIVSENDRSNIRKGVNRSDSSFKRLYASRWQALGMQKKLEKAVNDAFNDHSKEMMWGTRGIRLVLNWGDVIDEIQGDAASRFAESYNEFMMDLEDKW